MATDLSVILWTDDTERLVPFYRDTLGLKEQSQGGFSIFEIGGRQSLAIGQHSEVSGKTKEPYRIMVNLTVDDIQAAYEQLKGKGVQFMRPPEQDMGVMIATFQDPDGNTLQLFQETG
jgi:predicted enzyme related to lactoylglutathione lyase